MTETLAAALVEAQKDMPAVAKEASANYGNYATLDSVIAKTRAHLYQHGLAINQYPEINDNGFPVLRTTITHVSGEERSSVMPLYLPKQDMQALGAAITYARRYAWTAALGLSSEEDDDGQALAKTAADAAAEDEKTLLALAREKGVDVTVVQAQIAQKRRTPTFHGWLRRQIERLQQVPAATDPPPGDGDRGADGAAAAAPPTPTGDDTKAEKKKPQPSVAQHSKLGALIGELEAAGAPIPDGHESWEAYSRAWAAERFGVESRADLTPKEMHALIDHMDSMSIPF